MGVNYSGKLKYTCLTIISLLLIVGLTLGFDSNTPGLGILGFIIGIIISIVLLTHERIIWVIKNQVIREKQKKAEFLTCPRCKIPVEKDPGICPQCNQKL